MGDLGRSLPKALSPVVNRPLILRHIDLLVAQGVRHVHVTVGHLADLVRNIVLAAAPVGVEFHFHFQAERLGLGHAVLQAADGMGDQPFVLILADIAFTAPRIAELFTLPQGVDGLVAVKTETDVDAIRRNFSVVHDSSGQILQVIEKPRDPPNMLKGTGQYAFTPAIHDAIRATPPSALRNEYELTDAIQTLIDSRAEVRVADVIDWDLNITFPADLLACNQHLQRQFPPTQCCASALPEGSQAVDCIIGHGVKATGPVDLARCVVTDHVCLSAGLRARDALITPEGIWS